ncbi:hypothetical protein [Pedobacter sp. SL55]|uniref:hypothetical protein n=1 Tax=Pedobacter sp. SL55 TaxID=2995161 RepID=UPI0022711A5F|nr:hypothetical protein [Pedobacter sp. SL55]WAC41075.1 hypothetical protein OVA16_01475 [Pedobacter sp. SL55]
MKVYKFWLRAQKGINDEQKRLNEAVEALYFALLTRLIRYYKTLENPTDRIVIEWDRYRDEYNVSVMYSFVTPHAYFSLECKGTKQYEMQYYIDDTIHTDEISRLFKGLTFFDRKVLRTFSEPFPDFFQAALKCQQQHIRQL